MQFTDNYTNKKMSQVKALLKSYGISPSDKKVSDMRQAAIDDLADVLSVDQAYTRYQEAYDLFIRVAQRDRYQVPIEARMQMMDVNKDDHDNISRLIKLIACTFRQLQVDPDYIWDKSRQQDRVYVRHSIFFLLYYSGIPCATVSNLGRLTGRNHATVIHGVKTAKDLQRIGNPEFLMTFIKVKEAFKAANDELNGPDNEYNRKSIQRNIKST